MFALKITRRHAREKLREKLPEIEAGLYALSSVLSLEAGQRAADQIPTRLDDPLIRKWSQGMADEFIVGLIEDLRRQNDLPLPE